MNQNFCHLHCHSQYSYLDGFGSHEKYTNIARRLGFTHLAMTDHGNIDGAIKFQKECEKNNITPIFGSELYMVPDIALREKGEKRSHVTLFVKNEAGWRNLLKLISLSNLEGFYYRPRISPELLMKHREGLIITTACSASFLSFPWGEELLQKLIKQNKEDIYLEVMPHNFQEQKDVNILCREYSSKYELPMVATNDSHFVNSEDVLNHEVLLAIQTKKKWKNTDRWKFKDSESYYLKSRNEMIDSFEKQSILTQREYRRALLNTMEIAEKCKNFTKIPEKKINLPLPKILEWEDEVIFLKRLCESGIIKIDKGRDEVYRKRLYEEIELIIKQGFVRYFLIVWELMEWCNKNNIFISPGRGSSAGSLVCYLLGITGVDPIKYNLLFSRFINPDRISLPDIDLDFPDNKRNLIRSHIEELYGEWNVSSVSTISVMGGKQALRDVSRVFDIPYVDVNKGCSSIISRLKGDEEYGKTIQEAFELFEDGKWFANKYPEVAKIAIDMEGTIRNKGVHAAALVISDEDLREGTRCAFTIDKDKNPVINWDKDDIEHVGLIKLDVLGLSMLSVLDETKRLIKENHGVDINFKKISLDDKKCYKEFSKGNNIGCFQVGSRGLRKYCKQVGVDNFNTLVDITALYRPGPLHSGISDSYIKRKKSAEKIPGLHSIYDEITKDTYGLLIYQEQIMLVAHMLAGLNWGTCDKIRKDIAKSKGKDALRRYEEQFVKGCLNKKTLTKDQAYDLWNDIVEYGKYSFNKCLTGDTILYRSGGGRHSKNAKIAIKEIYDTWNSKTSTGNKYRNINRGLKIQQLDESDNRIRPRKIKNIFYNGKKKVYEIKTEAGRSIKATFNHKFLSNNFKYTEVKDLEKGMALYCMGPYEKTEHKKTGVPRFRGLGDSYEGKGFQNGENNIGYVDGREISKLQAKKEVFMRSKGMCESCNKKIYKFEKDKIHKIGRPEFAHIKAIEDCDGDYSSYHSSGNILFLCNSCHKNFDYLKKERKIRHSKGRPLIEDKIDSVEYFGIEDTYDIEMEDPYHNFVANEIISHNSHSVVYTVLTYWGQYLKQNYPGEFICALLTYGASGTDKDSKKTEFIQEAFRLGIDVRFPKVGLSDPYLWVIKDNILYAPFIEIKGVGPKTAEGFKKLESKGFYKKENGPVAKRFLNILDKINAYDNVAITDEEADKLSEYTGLSFVRDSLYQYKNFIKFLCNSGVKIEKAKNIKVYEIDTNMRYYFGKAEEVRLSAFKGDGGRKTSASILFRDDTGDFQFAFEKTYYNENVEKIEHSEDLYILIKVNIPKKSGNIVCHQMWFAEDLLRGEFNGLKLKPIKRTRYENTQLLECGECQLRGECRAPVLPSKSNRNIMIIGEAPGADEDKRGAGFVGDSGKKLWEQIEKNGFLRRDFHITNVCKCYPGRKIKTPTRRHIEKCSKWLNEEFEKIKPFVVLACGNTSIKFFTEEESGIMNKNGEIEWNEKYGCFISWVIHPASTIYNPENKEMFQDGIKNFCDFIKRF